MINPEWCSRCLVVMDTRTIYQARWSNTQKIMEGTAGNPRGIINWAESMMRESGGDAIFTNGPYIHVLEAISTWNGDPVCEVHLFELRHKELREPTRRVR